MPQSAAYNTTLKVGGTPTTMTNEACTKITANTVYRITAASKRVLDPDTAVVVEVDPLGGGSWVAGTGYSVDYFTGTVTFAADQGSSALVRVSGKYLPLYDIAFARSADLATSFDELDVTDFESGGDREFVLGMFRGELGMEVVSDADDDLDGGGNTLRDLLDGRDSIFIEYQPGGQGTFIRFWALLKTRDTTSPADGLVTSSLSAVLTVRDPAAGLSVSTVASS